MPPVTLAIVSDIHHAGAAERARGLEYETRGIRNPVLRIALRLYRHHIWLRDPLHQSHLLEIFLRRTRGCDYAVANGDYTCDSAFLGVSDPAARESVAECLGWLRGQFGSALRITLGDHELGKVSFFGGRGGMRLASWRCAIGELGLEPLWTLQIGRYRLVGVVSSLLALPVFEGDTLIEERSGWEELRSDHRRAVTALFDSLEPEERVLLFCHDPTALAFLAGEAAVRAKLPQIEQTIIGHLHSPLVLKQAQLMAGMPSVSFLGHTVRRMTLALRQARLWEPFKVRLCPSLAGIELLRDGGFYTAEIDPDAARPVQFRFCPLAR